MFPLQICSFLCSHSLPCSHANRQRRATTTVRRFSFFPALTRVADAHKSQGSAIFFLPRLNPISRVSSFIVHFHDKHNGQNLDHTHFRLIWCIRGRFRNKLLQESLGMRVCVGWRQFLLFVTLVFFVTHFLSVLELHQSSNVKDSHQKKTKKSDHLVFGPAAGEGLPNRLQCKGIKALNKTHVPASSNIGAGIAFVTVFTVYNSSVNGKSSDSTTVGEVSYNKVGRSMAILNTFINFIQLTMPESKTIILTDPSCGLPLKRNRVKVYPIQGEYSRDKLMLQRIKSYIAFLDGKLEEQSRKQGQFSHFIFTDSDIAVVSDVGHIFNKYEEFHLALTFRNNKQQPLNSGFIAVRGTPDGILRAKIFLEEVLNVYSSKYIKASRMLGDQLALAWVIKSHASFDQKKFSRQEAFLEEIGGASVLFLPCAVYNWTPPEGAGQFHGMPLDVKVVHFKGSRKRLMLESWNLLNSSRSRDLSDMLCLILSSGRTKYDF